MKIKRQTDKRCNSWNQYLFSYSIRLQSRIAFKSIACIAFWTKRFNFKLKIFLHLVVLIRLLQFYFAKNSERNIWLFSPALHIFSCLAHKTYIHTAWNLNYILNWKDLSSRWFFSSSSLILIPSKICLRIN